MNIKTTLFLLSLLTGIIWLAGCTKTNSSIVGVWTETSQNGRVVKQGVQIFDSTIYAGSFTATVLTLTAGDSFSSQPISSLVRSGTYSYSSGKITLVNTGINGWISFYVPTLTSHSLSLQLIDTSATNPLTINYTTYNFSR